MTIYVIIILIVLLAGFIWITKKKRIDLEPHVLISLIGICIFIIWLLPRKATANYEFLQDIIEISSIEIVRVGDYVEEEQAVRTYKVQEIEDINGFLEDFSQIECKSINYGSPDSEELEGQLNEVIKILYKNGEYELIDYKGQLEYTHTKGYRARTRFILDRVQYNMLISFYMTGVDIYDYFE